MERLFDTEMVEDPKRVKMDFLNLKGHASLQWDLVKLERKLKSKDIIRTWNMMVAKLKGRLFPIDYTLNLYRKLHKLRKREMSVKEYTEEFYRFSIKSRHIDEGDEAYQLALKAEENSINNPSVGGTSIVRGSNRAMSKRGQSNGAKKYEGSCASAPT